MITVGMKSKYKDLPDQEMNKLVDSLVQGKKYLRELAEEIEGKMDAHYRAMHNRANYKDANWAFEQADSLGYIRGLEEIYRVITGLEKPKRGRGRPRNDERKPKPLGE